jgi:type II pantothenate kinase
VDIVLGVIPFVRELLKRQTKVILCANSEPSLNDVTYSELTTVVVEIAKSCAVIESCLKSGKLIIKESGQAGCCLNFLDLNE